MILVLTAAFSVPKAFYVSVHNSKPGDNMSQAAGTRLPDKTEQQIDKLVRQGFYMSRSEFIRDAVREKLASVRVIQLREDVNFQQAKREVLEYVKTKGTVWTSEIANDLRLDLEVVAQALQDLEREGEVA